MGERVRTKPPHVTLNEVKGLPHQPAAGEVLLLSWWEGVAWARLPSTFFRQAVLVTLKVPLTVYQQAKEQAEATNRDVEEIFISVLAEAFSSTSQQSRDEALLREQAAYAHMQEELVANYEGEFVAIHNGQLVDHDADISRLALRIDEGYGEEVVHIRRVTKEPRPPLRVRSPRWVHE